MNSSVSLGAFLAVAIAFTTKHVLADFVLQPSWMARGKERVTGWLVPLLAHAGMHALLTLLIVLCYEPRRIWLAALDFLAHVVVDRAKARIALRKRWSVDQPQFWWLLGFDQYLHQLTNLLITALLVVP